MKTIIVGHFFRPILATYTISIHYLLLRFKTCLKSLYDFKSYLDYKNQTFTKTLSILILALTILFQLAPTVSGVVTVRTSVGVWMAARASRSRASVRVRRGGAGTRASVRARRPRSEITATRRASVGTTRLATLRAGRAGVSGATLDRCEYSTILHFWLVCHLGAIDKLCHTLRRRGRGSTMCDKGWGLILNFVTWCFGE